MKKLFILVALLCASAAAYAAPRYVCCDNDETPTYGLYTNTSRVEFFGGVAWPESDWTKDGSSFQVADTGFAAGIAFARNILPFLSLGLDGNYTGFSKGKDVTLGTNTYNFRSGVATALVAGRLYLFPKQMTRIYGTAGIGGGYMYTKEKNTTANSSEIYDSLDIAWMFGAGVEFDMDDDIILGAEARYNWVGLRKEMKDHFDQNNFDYWSVMLKLGVRF